MPVPTDLLPELSHAECLELLASGTIGRVALSVDALPAVFPVNYRLIGDEVVFRSAEGSKLTAAANQNVVGFEVDQVDTENRYGWSVLVVGEARIVSDPATLAVLTENPIDSWLKAVQPFYIGISLQKLSGRRLPGTRV